MSLANLEVRDMDLTRVRFHDAFDVEKLAILVKFSAPARAMGIA
jgi:hypothetical protein